MQVVTTATAGRKALVLGDNEWSRAEGLDVSALPRDASVIRVTPTATYIAGRDDPTADAEKAVATASVWSQYYERGTLHGVYEFLERYAGVRMYFPGELGTVVPRRDALELPVGTTVDAPAFATDRRYSIFWDGQYFDESEKGWDTDICRAKTLQSYRNRCTTTDVPCCHGSVKFNFADRFGESHPEYFALVGPNDERSLPGCLYQHHVGQLCWTSGIVDEIYEDAKAYLTGAAASTRGLSTWGVNCRHGKYVDIMPQDGFTGCKCKNCQAAYNKAESDYADDLMWGTTASIASRLRADGVGGYLTMMAYSPYKRVPDVELPPNVLVMVACQGPWAKTDAAELAAQKKLIADWTKKLGHKVWLWNYVLKTAMPGVPQFAPKAWGEFYGSVAPWIDGAFAESESDKFIYNYLNYYLFGKLCWNPKRDWREILSEHNRLMFGAAAGDMRVIFDFLERKWLTDIVAHTAETALGPVASSPDLLTLWTKIWSPRVIGHLDELFDRAAAKVGDGTIEARRVAFFREQFAGGLRQASQDYFDRIDPAAEEAWRAGHTGLTDIIRHGDFSGILHSDRYFKETKDAKAVEWYGAYSPNQATTELDEETYHDAPPSMRIAKNPDKDVNEIMQYLDAEGRKLKPNTKYRLSFFLKLQNVEPLVSGGGFTANIWDDKNVWFVGTSSNRAMCGTTSGWIAQNFEFTTGPKTNDGISSYMLAGLRNATGTVWIDDVRLEELPSED